MFASSDFCEYAGIVYGDKVLTVQAHPEFTIPFADALISSDRADMIDTEARESALSGLKDSQAAIDANLLSHMMQKFFRKFA